jgi:hypothetical protein
VALVCGAAQRFLCQHVEARGHAVGVGQQVERGRGDGDVQQAQDLAGHGEGLGQPRLQFLPADHDRARAHQAGTATQQAGQRANERQQARQHADEDGAARSARRCGAADANGFWAHGKGGWADGGGRR